MRLNSSPRQNALEKQRVIRFERFNVEPSAGQEKLLNAIAQDIQTLDAKAMSAQRRPLVQVVGHTESIGTAEAKLRLSQQRAERVVALLTSRNVPSAILIPVGVADGKPFYDNDTNVNALLNHCVSFQVDSVVEHP